MLYQNDDYGKDYLKGFEDGLGDKAKTMIVSKVSYEVTDPRWTARWFVEGLGADTFFNITTPKFAAQAIKKAAEDRLEAHAIPEQRVGLRGSVLSPAGLENSVGHHHLGYIKDPTDPQFQKGKEWKAWMRSTTRAAT